MNRLITSIIVCFVAITTMAQTADIEVSYNMRSFSKTPPHKISEPLLTHELMTRADSVGGFTKVIADFLSL